MADRKCTVVDCGRKHRAKGLCSAHYNQVLEGRPLAPLGNRRGPGTVQGPFAPSEIESFWLRVDKTDTCWNWIGARSTLGYGYFKYFGSRTIAYRYSWELANGKIQAGASIDHICHNTSCVRPEHLREVTHKQNMEHRNGAHANSKSGVRGVHWDKQSKKWRASVVHNRRRVHLGYFESLAEADAAAQSGRDKYFTHSD